MTDKYEALREAVDQSGDLSACIRECWPHPKHKGVVVVGDVDFDEGSHHPFVEIRSVRPEVDGAASLLGRYITVSHPDVIADLLAERDSLFRMFGAACVYVGSINEALALDPDDGGAAPIIGAIQEIQAERDALREALKSAAARIEDMLMDDDGHAWEEARKALPAIHEALKKAE